MPWFPLPMPENEVDLLDGLRRSTRLATVSEKPMSYVRLVWIGYRGGSEEKEMEVYVERELLRGLRGRFGQATAYALQIAGFPRLVGCDAGDGPQTTASRSRVKFISRTF